MICIASRIGVTERRNRSERPASTPSGIPISSESETAAVISANVCTLSSQRPISANDANAAATPSAALRLPKRSTTTIPKAAVPTQVSLKKKLVSHETRLSRKVAKPLKIVKKKLGFGRLRSLLSQFWNRSR